MALFTYIISCLLALQAVALARLQAPDQQFISNPQHGLSSTVRDILVQSSIIPEVLDDFEPTYELTVSFVKSLEPVMLGNDIPTSATSDRPAFEFHPILDLHALSDVAVAKTFTLILTDPDAKSRDDPKWSEYCHWIITNFTLADTQDLIDGELVEYLPPSPPPKTGKHRYVFVLLEGDTTALTAPEERMHWGYEKVRHGVRQWAEEQGLTVVGANFFYAQDEKQ